MLVLMCYAAKTQRPVKASTGCANAGVTAVSDHYAVVFDGVSGVPPPVAPEGLARDMRDSLRYSWLAGGQFFNPSSVPTTPTAGMWLENLIVMAGTFAESLGSACVAMLDARGNSVFGPLQFTACVDRHRAVDALTQTVRQGTVQPVKGARPGDLLTLFSDGVADDAAGEELRRILCNSSHVGPASTARGALARDG
ncbi:unnamed protein product, partial [Prorocentrum cordatum]